MALSAPSAACSGPEKHAQIPAAMINAERPLALIVIGNLPILPAPKAQGELRACPQRGKKRESSGESGRKQGNAVRPGRRNPVQSVREIVLGSRRRCQPDRTML